MVGVWAAFKAGIAVIDSHHPPLLLLPLVLYLLFFSIVKRTKEMNSEALKGSANGEMEESDL